MYKYSNNISDLISRFLKIDLSQSLSTAKLDIIMQIGSRYIPYKNTIITERISHGRYIIFMLFYLYLF